MWVHTDTQGRRTTKWRNERHRMRHFGHDPHIGSRCTDALWNMEGAITLRLVRFCMAPCCGALSSGGLLG